MDSPENTARTWRTTQVAMEALVGAGILATIALAVRHHSLDQVLAVAVNVGLLAVACLALIVARSQAVAARTANALTEQARQEAASRERDAAEQAIADSQRATRPYLWVDLATGLAGPPTWDLIIRNTGRSTAKDIHINADPWPDPGDALGDYLRAQLTRPFDLPPNASLRFLWRTAQEGDQPGNPRQPAGMPEATTVNLSYHGDDLAAGSFEDTRLLDQPTRSLIMPSPQEGPQATGATDPIRTLKDINHALRTLNVHVGELRR